MFSFTCLAMPVFEQAIRDYHVRDHVDAPIQNPYADGSIENRLYLKCWIDTVQWHLEDLIRDPQIEPEAGMVLKRRIDRSNQERTDLVEQIDGYFRDCYKDVAVLPTATLNTESPAWAIDRLSILALKIWHMQEQTERTDASDEHRQKCQAKLDVLLEQKKDLSTAIDQLLDDIAAGRKYMRVYRQMKSNWSTALKQSTSVAMPQNVWIWKWYLAVAFLHSARSMDQWLMQSPSVSMAAGCCWRSSSSNTRLSIFIVMNSRKYWKKRS